MREKVSPEAQHGVSVAVSAALLVATGCGMAGYAVHPGDSVDAKLFQSPGIVMVSELQSPAMSSWPAVLQQPATLLHNVGSTNASLAES